MNQKLSPMNTLPKMALVAALLLGTAYQSDAQLYVRVRPIVPRERVIVTRPVAPSPRHVWIDEDWNWRNGRYEYVGGRWEAPPQEGWLWRPGHWRNGRRGYVWAPGHWARR